MQSTREDTTFVKITSSEIKSNDGYENCKFIGCELSYANLSGILFIDCVFQDCNLTLIDVTNTGLQNIVFKHCKLSGVNFSKSKDFLFALNFERCILDNAIFFRKKNKGATFTECSMLETDLTEADLSNAKFINCNLSRAFFDRTELKNADFRSSYNFSIDPDKNSIKKTMFSLHGLPGLLEKYDIKVD